VNRRDLRALSTIRIGDAKALLDAGHFAGAYYLAGHSIECALKACVARQIHAGDFPDKKLAGEAFTHDLAKLVATAGLDVTFAADRKANSVLDVNWATVKDWTVDIRYDTTVTASRSLDFYAACVGRNGILPWVKRRW
jgi:AbiV family abortive infection protein